MYRIEHGGAQGRVNIDTVVDLDNLRAKLQKWHCEGFVRGGVAEEASAPLHREDFMQRLHSAMPVYAASTTRDTTVKIADVAIERGAGGRAARACRESRVSLHRMRA